MIKESNSILICPSLKLKDMKLTGLIGKTGIVTEDLTYRERKNKGYMVQLNEPYLNDYNWFIPYESVKAYETLE